MLKLLVAILAGVIGLLLWVAWRLLRSRNAQEERDQAARRTPVR